MVYKIMPSTHQNSAIEEISSIDRNEALERSKRALAAHEASLVQSPDYQKSFSLPKTTLSPKDFQATFEKAKAETFSEDFSITQKRAPFSDQMQLPSLENKGSSQISNKERKAVGIELAKAIQRNEEILNEITDILLKNIDVQNKAILKLSNEEREHLDKLIAQLSKKENVDTVKRLLNVAVASTAIITGSILLAPEILALAASSAAYSSISSLWGYLLVASGVSNIATNEFFPRFNIFQRIASFFTNDETEVQNLAQNIQVGTSLANTILSLASAIATSPLLGAVLDWSFGTKILNIATDIADGTVNIISDVNSSSFKQLQAEKTLIDGEKQGAQNDLEKSQDNLESAALITETFNRMCFTLFTTITKINDNFIN